MNKTSHYILSKCFLAFVPKRHEEPLFERVDLPITEIVKSIFTLSFHKGYKKFTLRLPPHNKKLL